MPTYRSDQLLKCSPPPGCQDCEWYPVAGRVCSGQCIGEQNICPWLLACPCLNPDMNDRRGTKLARLVGEQPPAAQLAVVAVPSDLIRLGEYEIRHKRDEEAIKELAASIHDSGLFAPPGGIAAPDAHIDILMGSSRVLAMTSQLGWQEIPVRVFHWWGKSTWDGIIAAFQENTIRRQMTFEEEVAVVYTYRQQTNETVREMARRFRKSKSWIQERISWGRRVYGDQPVPKAPTLKDEPRLPKRRQPARVTLPQSEVEEWLSELHKLGITPENEVEHVPTHPSGSSALNDLRQAMRVVISRLQEDRAAPTANTGPWVPGPEPTDVRAARSGKDKRV